MPRLWPDSTIVCIAGGPSLTPEDVAFCQGKARVIAINDAYRLAPWADVLYAADAAWWRRHWSAVKTFAGLKFSIGSCDTALPEPNTVQYLRNTGLTGLERDPRGLRTGKNSGFQSINLAAHLGAKRIVLLGYDMGHAPGQPSHWFGEHPAGLNRHSPYAAFLECFASLIAPLKALGIEVLNCSRQTRLNCFPRFPLEKAL